jgi:hypothetical protein
MIVGEEARKSGSNCKAADAEQYYQSMFEDHISSWNLRELIDDKRLMSRSTALITAGFREELVKQLMETQGFSLAEEVLVVGRSSTKKEG